MKICLVTTGLGVGGAEVQVKNLANEFIERGHEVSIISLTGKNQITGFNQKVRIVNLHFKKNLKILLLPFYLSKEISKFQPDIVHSHMIHANIVSRISKLFYRIPKLVCTAHSSSEGGNMVKYLYIFTDFLCDVTTNVSEAATFKYIKDNMFKKEKTLTVPNGISIQSILKITNNFTKIQNKKHVFIAVGRLTKAKGYDVLLSAVSSLKFINSNFLLLIVGEGEERSEIEDFIKKHNLGENIALLGHREDVLRLVLNADTFTMSSKWEGLPMVLLEAALCKIPIIATDVGGIPELISENGDIVASGDANALSEKMLDHILNSNEVYKKKSSNLYYKVVEKYDIKKVVDIWLDLYKKNSLRKF